MLKSIKTIEPSPTLAMAAAPTLPYQTDRVTNGVHVSWRM